MKINKPKRFNFKTITKYFQNGFIVDLNNINPNKPWSKRQYNSNGNKIYFERSNGDWEKYEYDAYGNRVCYKNSYGFWSKWEYDDFGNVVYYEASDGEIRGKR